MKKYIIGLTLLFSGAVLAQEFTTENHKQTGSYEYFVCDSIIESLADETGVNRTWDYSAIEAIAGEHKLLNVNETDDSVDSVFSVADEMIEIEDYSTEYIIKEGAEVTRKGVQIIHPELGTVNAYFDPMPISMEYPLGFNETVQSSFSGGADVPLLGMVGVPMFGEHETIFDGWGVLKIGNTTINNVARLQSYDSIKVDTQDPDVGYIDVVLRYYEYYNFDLSSAPIFIRGAYDIILPDTDPLVTPIVLSKYNPEEEQTLGGEHVGVEELTTEDFRIYPNPVGNNMILTGDFDRATVEIITPTGQIVLKTEVQGKKTISTADLAPGMYMVKATIKNQVVTKKMMKR